MGHQYRGDMLKNEERNVIGWTVGTPLMMIDCNSRCIHKVELNLVEIINFVADVEIYVSELQIFRNW